MFLIRIGTFISIGPYREINLILNYCAEEVFIQGGACDVTVIVLGNELSYLGSNPKQGYLHFT